MRSPVRNLTVERLQRGHIEFVARVATLSLKSNVKGDL
jgi:hypothetical protein